MHTRICQKIQQRHQQIVTIIIRVYLLVLDIVMVKVKCFQERHHILNLVHIFDLFVNLLTIIHG
jgi:hypothetical protein